MAATLDSPAGLEADFIALICADDDLLRAEFEEIVSAGWGPPPPPANGSTMRVSLHVRINTARQNVRSQTLSDPSSRGGMFVSSSIAFRHA